MIKLDWTIFLQFVNFFVLIAVLNVLLYRPLRNILEQRRQTVAGSRQRARELQEEIEGKMARYQEQLQAAKHEANQERAQLRQAAAAEEGEILGKARTEAGDRLQTIKNQVAGDAAEARTSLRGETRELAAAIAAKILGREVEKA